MIIIKYIAAFLMILHTSLVFSDVSRLQIWTIEREPFAYQNDGVWEWFSIDIWKEIAEKNNFDYDFVSHDDFSVMLENTTEKKYDASIANISVTVEREKVLDFSTPFYDSGLNIMSLSANNEVFSFYNSYSSKILFLLQVVWAFLFILTHYFFVSNVLKDNITWLSYPKEIIPIFFEVLSQIKETLWMKILLPISWIMAVLVVSFVSQKFTIVLNGFDSAYAESNPISFLDIDWKSIWVTKSSVGESFLEKKWIVSQSYSELTEAYSDLESWVLNYIVTDDPVLRYYAKNNVLFQVVWKTFNPDQYAIVFPQYKGKDNANFIKKVNVAILEMKESGKYDEIYSKYFE